MFKNCFILMFIVIAFCSYCEAQDYIADVAFIKLGTYRVSKKLVKRYYIPKYLQAVWTNTRAACKAYGMDILSLETKAEHDNFLKLCVKNANVFDQWTHVGAINLAEPVIPDGTITGGVVPPSTEKWYWVNSGKRITYSLQWGISQPDNGGPNKKEYCLSIGKYNDGSLFAFNDLDCYGMYEFKFICQKKN